MADDTNYLGLRRSQFGLGRIANMDRFSAVSAPTALVWSASTVYVEIFWNLQCIYLELFANPALFYRWTSAVSASVRSPPTSVSTRFVSRPHQPTPNNHEDWRKYISIRNCCSGHAIEERHTNIALHTVPLNKNKTNVHLWHPLDPFAFHNPFNVPWRSIEVRGGRNVSNRREIDCARVPFFRMTAPKNLLFTYFFCLVSRVWIWWTRWGLGLLCDEFLNEDGWNLHPFISFIQYQWRISLVPNCIAAYEWCLGLALGRLGLARTCFVPFLCQWYNSLHGWVYPCQQRLPCRLERCVCSDGRNSRLASRTRGLVFKFTCMGRCRHLYE